MVLWYMISSVMVCIENKVNIGVYDITFCMSVTLPHRINLVIIIKVKIIWEMQIRFIPAKPYTVLLHCNVGITLPSP